MQQVATRILVASERKLDYEREKEHLEVKEETDEQNEDNDSEEEDVSNKHQLEEEKNLSDRDSITEEDSELVRKCKIENWNLPSNIVSWFKSKGVHNLFPWQVNMIAEKRKL